MAIVDAHYFPDIFKTGILQYGIFTIAIYRLKVH